MIMMMVVMIMTIMTLVVLLIFQALIVGAVSSETDLIFSLLAGDAKLFNFTLLTLSSTVYSAIFMASWPPQLLYNLYIIGRFCVSVCHEK